MTAKVEAMREELDNETISEIDEIERIMAVERKEIEPINAIADLVLVLPTLFRDFPGQCNLPRPDSEINDAHEPQKTKGTATDPTENEVQWVNPWSGGNEDWRSTVPKRWLHLMRSYILFARTQELKRRMEAACVVAVEDCSTCEVPR